MLVVTETPVEVRNYTIGELAQKYGIDPRTLRKRLEPFSEKLGKIIRGQLDYHQVLIIFKELGPPGVKVVEESLVDGFTVVCLEKNKTMYVLPKVA
ncbi:MAG TPA: hypothetical protein VD905_19595 [Flavobacteriales bacterium]|nr:hypothetical protein [Flavobacteriales bacterium]